MDKVLTIDEKKVGFRASALTPRLYRHKFGRDIVRDMNQLKKAYDKAMKAKGLEKPPEDAPQQLQEEYQEALQEAQLSVMDLEIFENTAWIMARQFDNTVPDDPDDWLENFHVFSIYEILPEIIKLWQLNQKTTSTPKKK